MWVIQWRWVTSERRNSCARFDSPDPHFIRCWFGRILKPSLSARYVSHFTLLWSACFWKFLMNTFILQAIWMFPGDASKSWMLVTSQLVPIWSSNIYLLHKLPHHWASTACGFQASCLLWNSAAFKITSSRLNTFPLNLSKAGKINWLQVGSCHGLCSKYRLCCCDTVPVTLSASSGRQVMRPGF